MKLNFIDIHFNVRQDTVCLIAWACTTCEHPSELHFDWILRFWYWSRHCRSGRISPFWPLHGLLRNPWSRIKRLSTHQNALELPGNLREFQNCDMSKNKIKLIQMILEGNLLAVLENILHFRNFLEHHMCSVILQRIPNISRNPWGNLQ